MVRLHTDSEPQKVVEDLRALAEFVCYSEQYKLDYFDVLMSENVLLVDMPRLLALDFRSINI